MNEIKNCVLHCHSENSLKDGICKIPEMVNRAKELGAKAITLTDHGVMTGMDEFISECEKNDIAAIPGVEAYVKEDNDIKRSHLILLAKDNIGYHQISKLVSKSNKRKSDGYPTVNKEMIKKYIFGGHVIITSACMQGVINHKFWVNEAINISYDKILAKIEKKENFITSKEKLNKDKVYIKYKHELENLIELKALYKEENLYDIAKNEALWYKQQYGDDFYIEVQNHRIPTELEVVPKSVQIAKELGIKIIAANDAHMVYGSEADKKARQMMKSLRFNKYEEENQGDSELYIKTDDELLSILSEAIGYDNAKEAVDNLSDLVEKCHYKKEKVSHYPKFDKTGKSDANKTLRELTYSKRYERYSNWDDNKQKRLDYELSIIEKMGYSDYHLIVSDLIYVGRKLGKLSDEKISYLKENIDNLSLNEFLSFIKENETEVGIGIGPGRGSAAGSMVCYLLGITNIDPMKNNLLFERK